MSYRHARPAVERLLRLALHLAEGNAVTIAYIMREHGASLATAKRDMTMLESLLPVFQEALPRCGNPGMPAKALRMMRARGMLKLMHAAAA